MQTRHLSRNHLNQNYNNLEHLLTTTTATIFSGAQANTASSMLQHHQLFPLLHNCTYRYDQSAEDDQLIGTVSLYMDGPLTLLGALLAFIGCHFAVKFLATAGLNKDLTAALYALCLCDAFLIFMVVLYHSIEATGILITGQNVMWNEQDVVLYTHGIVSSATTASTLLVVFITFQRFLVVMFPMRYARNKAMDTPVRRVSSLEDLEVSNGLLTRTVSKKFFHRKSPSLRKLIRPFIFPVFVVAFALVINSTVFFEFELVDCFNYVEQRISTHLYPTVLRQSQTYNVLRTVIMMTTQTVGPISTISLLTCITEYKVHASLKARRSLFEAQHRRRSIVLVEELREKLSRTVAIFIAVKFLILRSLPIFFDIYETFYGIESFGIVLSILVRISDFGVVLNAAPIHWLISARLSRQSREIPSSNGLYSTRHLSNPPSPLTLCKTRPVVELAPAFNDTPAKAQN
uniref:G protein-coupled receptor n=1 Tax=Ditylenchus dipsaci TaxID=166011 RepID=A0A915DHD1_9BILA